MEELKSLQPNMKITAVICEYNPFHNGHKYMLDTLRKNGTTHIAAVMSGNFVQRGEPALFDKYTRTRAALSCGADLVLELPVSYAVSGAERFALGGVAVSDALGCADELAFGSECADIAALKAAAEGVMSGSVQQEIARLMDSGITFAAAREQAVRSGLGDNVADVLKSPNDILGVEYIKALTRIGSAMTPVPVKRTGAAHDSGDISGGTASASMIRELIAEGKPYRELVPEEAYELYSSYELPAEGRSARLETAWLYRLRTMSVSQLAVLPEVGEGLEHRIYSAIRQENTIEGIMTAVKSKRYTRARIRRILCYALLGFECSLLSGTPQYIRVLGFNSRGQEILRESRRKAKLPVIMRYSDAAALGEGASDFALETRADDIYALSEQTIAQCGRNCTEGVVVIK